MVSTGSTNGGSTNGQRKYTLDESEMPTHWYNLMADLPAPPPPPLHPGTHQPVGPEDLLPLFPIELIMQEVSGERYIEIPEAVRDVYRQWRPSPLIRARTLGGRSSAPRPGSTTSTRAFRRPAPTRPTRPCRRSTTTLCTAYAD